MAGIIIFKLDAAAVKISASERIFCRKKGRGKIIIALADKDFEEDALYNKSRLEQLVYYKYGKTRLEKLFGSFSDTCFDRLMSIHVFGSPVEFNSL